MKKHLTLAILQKNRFDENRYEILVEKLGPDYSDETPLTLATILELNEISDCLCVFQYFDECHHEVLKKIAVELAVYCAADVLPIFEKVYPENDSPRKAIAAARAWLANPNDETAKAATEAAEAANSFSCAAYASYVSKSKYALYLKTLLEKHGF